MENVDLKNERQPSCLGAVIGWWSGGITSAIACRFTI